MKSFCFILAVTLMSTCTSVCAQTKKKYTFPTYEQIRGNKSEIYDFVTPQNISTDPASAVPVIGKYSITKRSIVTEHGFDLFGYPQDSVTYILNGRKEKSAKRAESEIRTKSRNITDISIGAVDGKGVRVIRIDYEVK